MIKAYVMITGDKSFSRKTTERLAKIQGIRVVDTLYGVYDVCIVVEAKGMQQLETVVVSKIRTIEGVGNTLTLLVARSTPV